MVMNELLKAFSNDVFVIFLTHCLKKAYIAFKIIFVMMYLVYKNTEQCFIDAFSFQPAAFINVSEFRAFSTFTS